MSTAVISLLEMIDLEEDKVLKEQYLYQLVSMVGGFDSAKRFNISQEFHTESSRLVRSPSRAWPFSELKHVRTSKYRKQLKAKLQAAI